MKILFVRTFCPNPIAYGSEMRSSRFVDYLTRAADVDLLTLTKPTELADRDYIKAKFNNFFYFDQVDTNSRLTPFEKLVCLLPWQLNEYYSKNIQQGINKIVEENQYDLIFVYKMSPALYFLRLPSKWRERTVIDFDDILSDLYLNHYANFFTARKNSYSLRLYEQKALKEFKRVFVCSREAVSKVPTACQKKAGIIPNVFAADKDGILALPRDNDRLLFIGSLDYFPNIEGLKWFFAQVWPAVKRSYPDLKLTVAGKSPKDGAFLHKSFGSPAGVEVEVNVPDVRPYYENCFASIVPLLNGSGTRLKILESVAYGRPVITTAKGMEGLEFEDGQDIFVFDDAASFIKSYEALLGQETYGQIRDRAFDLLEKNYSPKAFESKMAENWQVINGNNHV